MRAQNVPFAPLANIVELGESVVGSALRSPTVLADGIQHAKVQSFDDQLPMLPEGLAFLGILRTGWAFLAGLFLDVHVEVLL